LLVKVLTKNHRGTLFAHPISIDFKGIVEEFNRHGCVLRGEVGEMEEGGGGEAERGVGEDGRQVSCLKRWWWVGVSKV